MIGTDSEILGGRPTFTIKNGVGRPRIDRNLVMRYLEAGYNPAQVAKGVKCSAKTVKEIRRELEREGALKKEDRDPLGKLIAVDFDEECKRATGLFFSEWLKSKRKRYRYEFNWCSKVWVNIWERPSLVRARDFKDNLSERMALKFLQVFGEDIKRIRSRKKIIRQLFTFLSRGDINDKFFTTTYRDPRSKRKVPEITLSNFPAKLDKAINEYERLYGKEAGIWIRTKICLQARTGNRAESRGMLGISRDSQNPSYLIFQSPDSFRGRILEKSLQEWPITWIPRRVRRELYEMYKNNGSPYFFNWTFRAFAKLSKQWKKISKKHTGVELSFHDLRKVSVTWLYAMGLPLLRATSLNVGWKDLNVARDHYLHVEKMLKNSEREEYRGNIPEWFKDGLEEYNGE